MEKGLSVLDTPGDGWSCWQASVNPPNEQLLPGPFERSLRESWQPSLSLYHIIPYIINHRNQRKGFDGQFVPTWQIWDNMGVNTPRDCRLRRTFWGVHRVGSG